jgi:hypothetical protein
VVVRELNREEGPGRPCPSDRHGLEIGTEQQVEMGVDREVEPPQRSLGEWSPTSLSSDEVSQYHTRRPSRERRRSGRLGVRSEESHTDISSRKVRISPAVRAGSSS